MRSFKVTYRVNTYKKWWRGFQNGFPGGVETEFQQGGVSAVVVTAPTEAEAIEQVQTMIQIEFPNTDSKDYEAEILDCREEVEE